VDGRGGAAVTVTVVVAEPQTVPSQTETRTCRVPAAAKVPATVNVLPVSANGFAPEPSSRSAVAAQVSVPGSANDPVSDHALPTSTVEVAGSVTVGATFATVSFAVSETTGLLPSSAVRVSVAVASSAHRTVVLGAAGSAMVHAASSTDQVAGADRHGDVVVGDPAGAVPVGHDRTARAGGEVASQHQPERLHLHRLRHLVGDDLDGDLPGRVLRGELDGAAGGGHVGADLGRAADDL